MPEITNITYRHQTVLNIGTSYWYQNFMHSLYNFGERYKNFPLLFYRIEFVAVYGDIMHNT